MYNFKDFPGGDTPDHRFKGRGRGRKGEREKRRVTEKGKEEIGKGAGREGEGKCGSPTH